MEDFALAQCSVLHDSAFMQTFCLVDELLCIVGLVCCSVNSAEDEADKRKIRKCSECEQAVGSHWTSFTLAELSR